MKTVEINIYKFNELDEKAQQKALERYYDINVDYDWWDATFEDAKNVGLKIESFDLGRGRQIEMDFVDGSYIVAGKITKDHGKDCKTYKLAEKFIQDYDSLVEKHSDGIEKDCVCEEKEEDFDIEADILDHDFLNSLKLEYIKILDNEYNWLTSEEAIKETFEANDYDFTENGKIY